MVQEDSRVLPLMWRLMSSRGAVPGSAAVKQGWREVEWRWWCGVDGRGALAGKSPRPRAKKRREHHAGAALSQHATQGQR